MVMEEGKREMGESRRFWECFMVDTTCLTVGFIASIQRISVLFSAWRLSTCA